LDGAWGPVFLENLEFSKSALDSPTPGPIDPSAVTITAFRRWVYCLDGEWIEELERLSRDEDPVTMLEEAVSRIQGLRPGDVSNGDLWRIVQAASQSMQRLRPANPSTEAAVALIECCSKCQDVFNNSQLASLKSELGNLQEWALQQQLWSTEDPKDEKPLDPWCLDSFSSDLDQYDDYYDAKPASGAIWGHKGQCLSMGFLAVMDESNLGMAM